LGKIVEWSSKTFGQIFSLITKVGNTKITVHMKSMCCADVQVQDMGS